MTTLKQIVLAEDNLADVYLVEEALKGAQVNCQLRVIADGEEALAFIDTLDAGSHIPCPDLVLLDMNMPKYDGEVILKRLRASERCGQTPVMILTSSFSPRDMQTAQKYAAVHYFRKPSSLDEFMELGPLVKGVISPGEKGKVDCKDISAGPGFEVD